MTYPYVIHLFVRSLDKPQVFSSAREDPFQVSQSGSLTLWPAGGTAPRVILLAPGEWARVESFLAGDEPDL